MKTITTIQGIQCYGEFDESSNVIVVGTTVGGAELEDVWCNDIGAATWAGAVRAIKAWADREGHAIDELGAC